MQQIHASRALPKTLQLLVLTFASLHFSGWERGGCCITTPLRKETTSSAKTTKSDTEVDYPHTSPVSNLVFNNK